MIAGAGARRVLPALRLRVIDRASACVDTALAAVTLSNLLLSRCEHSQVAQRVLQMVDSERREGDGLARSSGRGDQS